MLKHKIALAVTAALLCTGVCAQENQAQPQEQSAVTGAVKNMMKSASALSGSKARRQAQNAQGDDANQYPAVPAKYLRPNADKRETKEAINQLAENVKQQDIEAANARRKPASAPVGQVQINTKNVIAMRPGENVFIPISREHPNRLLTPFKNPQIVSTSLFAGKKKGECGEACVRDGVIYITTDSPSAVTAFITEKGHEDIAFSVTMVPQAIPPREVRFTLPTEIVEKLNSRSGSASAVKKAQAWEMSQPYVDTLRDALRSVALGEIPSGYNLRKLRVTDPQPMCKHLGLEFKWDEGQLLEGYNLDIYVGVVKNIADSPVEFRAQNCGGWKTAAVTTWPLTVLEPGQATEIYVVAKHQDDIPQDLVRKPLIPREYN